MKRTILLWLSNITLLINTACGQYKDFDQMLADMYRNTVPFIHPDSLYSDLQKGENIVIIDSREKKEYAVSHIKGAIYAGYDDFRLSRIKDIPKNSRIVVYCSVGYRSERIGEKLQNAGFTNVSNLYGGIFQWKNSNLPVFKNEVETDTVHAYSKKWGVWLKKGIKVYE